MLRPTYFARTVTDITLEFLKKENIKGLVLDVDDTMVARKIKIPDFKTKKWTENLKTNGIKLILLSNNFKHRVGYFAEKLDLPYVYFALKPLPFGLKKAADIISCKRENILLIGDQIFTDILSANLFKIRSTLVKPITENKSLFFKIKRYLEKIVKSNIPKNERIYIENKKDFLEVKSDENEKRGNSAWPQP